MYKREEEKLIDKRHFERGEEGPPRKKIKSKRTCLCCCCVCFIVVVIVVVAAVGLHKLYKFSLACVSGSQELDLSLMGVPRNLSEFVMQNSKLCSSVSGQEPPNSGHIYIVKGERNLTDEQACGVESVLRLFPDKTIYLIDFNKEEHKSQDTCSSYPNYLGLLSYLYKDRLNLVLADKAEFFRNTPLQVIQSRDKHFEFMAMLLTAYKYGGLVTSPDVLMTNRDLIECFPEETVVEPFAILASRKCDHFLHYLMQSFILCGHNHNMSLEDTLSESAVLYSKTQVPSARRLAANEVCENAKEPCTFLKLKGLSLREAKWICDVSTLCKQVIQAMLGMKMKIMEVEEETSKIRLNIARGVKPCAGHANMSVGGSGCDHSRVQ